MLGVNRLLLAVFLCGRPVRTRGFFVSSSKPLSSYDQDRDSNKDPPKDLGVLFAVDRRASGSKQAEDEELSARMSSRQANI